MKTIIHFVKSAFILNAVLLSLGCDQKSKDQVNVTQVSPVIYGEDDRKDYDEITDPNLKEIARSTIAFVEKESMTLDRASNVYRFGKPEDSLNFCSSEKFLEQPTWSYCSGSLIAPDLILTAGHCVMDQKDCESAFYIFDYQVHGAQKTFNQVPAKNVYTCSRLVHSSRQKDGADFAIVRLDRKVEGRLPLQFSDKEVTLQDQLLMIGHPKGYPTKFTFNGKVRSLENPSFLRISMDAYKGNSGSSVFDQITHKIVGVLSRGEIDYVRENGCIVSKVCEEETGCRGEDVTRIEEVKKFLPPASH